MFETVIEAQNLNKSFPGGMTGVVDLNFQVRRGSVFGLIGRNGAGKTTAMRLLMGLLRADQGQALILGNDLWKAPRSLRARIAYVSQTQQLHSWMTLQELARYVGHFYEKWDSDLAKQLARRWEIGWNRQINRMSGGEQRKVAVLLAFASRPEVLILDEPMAGLDPLARRSFVDEMIELISEGQECTILFSTHIVGDLERIAEFVGIMDQGRMIAASKLDDLQNSTKRVQVVFPSEAPPDGFAIPGAIRTEVSGPVVTAVVRLVHESQLDDIRYLPGARLNVFSLGLEEIFFERLRELVETKDSTDPGEEFPRAPRRETAGFV